MHEARRTRRLPEKGTSAPVRFRQQQAGNESKLFLSKQHRNKSIAIHHRTIKATSEDDPLNGNPRAVPWVDAVVHLISSGIPGGIQSGASGRTLHVTGSFGGHHHQIQKSPGNDLILVESGVEPFLRHFRTVDDGGMRAGVDAGVEE